MAADVAGSGYLRPDAKTQYDALNSAFQTRFGKALRITEGYRPFARQDALFRERYVVDAGGGIYYAGQRWTKRPEASVAAVPGESNHGWGTACDFGAGVNVGGSAENNWMDANAPAFGYNPTVPSEPWHFDYTRSYNDQGDDDLTPEQDQRLKNLEAILAVDNGGGMRAVLADVQTNAYQAASRSKNVEAIVAVDNGGGIRAAVNAIRAKLGA
ncbi:D-alanyl-D-alanine carboxypeptidase family protein [Frigoribacterium sp. PhB107]|uniref:M15 family metallopeptidase n=1 Tax=Frigoribacterium sp. PhB107 TaxID=2485172 RepID=UPI00131523E8|nr:M15 family metallopeptidase [Frigoribacterium sp. PhB107]